MGNEAKRHSRVFRNTDSFAITSSIAGFDRLTVNLAKKGDAVGIWLFPRLPTRCSPRLSTTVFTRSSSRRQLIRIPHHGDCGDMLQCIEDFLFRVIHYRSLARSLPLDGEAREPRSGPNALVLGSVSI